MVNHLARVGLCLAVLANAAGSRAQEAAPATGLPQPLSLEYALSLADEPHPELMESRAALDLARAERTAVNADDDVSAVLSGTLAWAEPDNYGEERDHEVGVAVRKRLYDFGYSEARSEAAEAGVRGVENDLLSRRQQRRISILEAFFDVIIADLSYARDNEAMALQYVRYDRLKDRRELKQASDLELFQAEANYQEYRARVLRSGTVRRATRVRLAEALNRPHDPPSDLERPDKLPGNHRAMVEVEALQALAAANNPRLLALRAELEAAKKQIEAARASDGPVLRGELDAGAQSRNLGSNANDWRAGIVLDVPLYDGGRSGARVARAEAEYDRVKARLAREEIAVRQAVLDSWLELEVLNRQREVDAARRDFTELNLDRSRTLYQMEALSDLGDSMVMTSESRLQIARTEFDIALAWARLDALAGAAPEHIVSKLLEGVRP